MQVSSAGFPSTLSVAPPVRWQQVGKPCSWRLLSLPPSLFFPSLHPPRISSVRLQTSMFKLQLSRKSHPSCRGTEPWLWLRRCTGLILCSFASFLYLKCYKPSTDNLIHCSCTHARAGHINTALGYVMLVSFLGKERGDLLLDDSWWVTLYIWTEHSQTNPRFLREILKDNCTVRTKKGSRCLLHIRISQTQQNGVSQPLILTPCLLSAA